MIGHVSLLVLSFIPDACCDFSKSKNPIFVKFVTDVQQLPMPNFTINFSEVGAKVQRQNRRTEKGKKR